ncbi:aminotransferase class III-fold pyridoxal phosphate-dependent enzyme [Erwinia amylovora]|uniref:Aminotransferase class III-fold pyridoxal phosphate-dependent enzyme n=4 Tax=Erwinia amylovora TaxID=552 RepID=A0ABX7MII6_ERWAM|nr:aminotransferase class III-fold pyridoxal phosphate-dependent enzyme [Erwinia amylovora]CDK14053.1 putative peptide synthetase protein [Erwinia amylovora LA635]CDK17420.1 putative peptide synthetase protein [Erwinia amylovora LA636]CDK20789.1 putative peptide synthetase protein [Erwinia amylovora LA637]ATZ12714.1 peptide synthetase [Erwinia amylovora]EKV55301.1 putative peptide synthetase protein [Erwinia amylovora ACW56400]
MDKSNLHDTEQVLTDLFSKVFELPPEALGRDTQLAELGADSLLLFEVLTPIQKAFGVKLSVRQFFSELQTVAKLAAYIHAHSQISEGPADARPAQGRPFQWMNRSNAPVESAARQQYLDEFIPRYNARTKKSKAHAVEVRNLIADSRSGIGFKPSIKELLYPLVCREFNGATLRDLDGNDYIDMTMGFGSHLFGHLPAFVSSALKEQVEEGFGLGTRHELALEVARLVCEITGMHRVAFVNSGTEAIMNAVRAARAATGRNHIVLFSSSYHGHWDAVLATADRFDAGAKTRPVSVGIPVNMVADVSVFEFGSSEALKFIASHGSKIAAVLIEPVPTRDPGLADPVYLQQLREATSLVGTLLIFDEIVTGFRVHPAGIQGLYGIEADIVTYGKTIGGGMPMGLIAGRGHTLDAIDGGNWNYGDNSFPGVEPTFFGGTFFQHPLAMKTARATLLEIKRGGVAFTQALSQKTAAFTSRLNDLFQSRGIDIEARVFSSFFRLIHKENMDLLYYNLLIRGVYIWEWRCWFLSAAHENSHLDAVFEAFVHSMDELQAQALTAIRK